MRRKYKMKDRQKFYSAVCKLVTFLTVTLVLVFGQGLFVQLGRQLDVKYMKAFLGNVIPITEETVGVDFPWQEVFFGFDFTNPLTILQSGASIANADQAPQPTPAPTQLPPEANPIEEVQIQSPAASSENISIKNHTDYSVNVDELVNEKLQFTIDDSGPSVLIVHTHASEAYTPTDKNYYLPTDPDRTEDINYNVVRVGEELANTLKDMGVNVLHDKTIHDYPSYNGSYDNCRKTVDRYLKEYPSIKIVLDVHRDGIVRADNTKLKVCKDIDGKKTAQVMIVTGTDATGLSHPNWRENLKFSMKLQRRVELFYPGLMRPIDLRQERFNQNTTLASIILEMGSSGNTLEEALNAAQCIGRALGDMMQFMK